jgi:hypothetical protein
MPMLSPRMRKKLLQKILQKASENKKYTFFSLLAPEELTYKHCRILAELMDWDSNSVARLFAIANFKATQSLSISSEKKILDFLGYETMQKLELLLLIETALDEIKNLLQSMK